MWLEENSWFIVWGKKSTFNWLASLASLAFLRETLHLSQGARARLHHLYDNNVLNVVCSHLQSNCGQICTSQVEHNDIMTSQRGADTILGTNIVSAPLWLHPSRLCCGWSLCGLDRLCSTSHWCSSDWGGPWPRDPCSFLGAPQELQRRSCSEPNCHKPSRSSDFLPLTSTLSTKRLLVPECTAI